MLVQLEQRGRVQHWPGLCHLMTSLMADCFAVDPVTEHTGFVLPQSQLQQALALEDQQEVRCHLALVVILRDKVTVCAVAGLSRLRCARKEIVLNLLGHVLRYSLLKATQACERRQGEACDMRSNSSPCLVQPAYKYGSLSRLTDKVCFERGAFEFPNWPWK